ncbi:MAG: hypothetical protein ACYDBJ_05895 [Aggregatilineales bacterium]
MSLSFNLQRLPPEALSVLRFLGRQSAAISTHNMESALDLSPRAIGRAIRRLVNYSLIQMDYNGSYQLTSDGRRAYEQMADQEKRAPERQSSAAAGVSAHVTRRLTIVLPHNAIGAQPVTMYIGVNPASGNPVLSHHAQVELRLGVIGGTLSTNSVSLDVPPDRAANPTTITVTAQPAVRKVRVRIDAFQIHDVDRADEVGNMYFDIPVHVQAAPEGSTRRAVGTDLILV